VWPVLGQVLSDLLSRPARQIALSHLQRADVLQNAHFLSTNTCLSVAYVEEARMLEVYRMLKPGEGYGVIELLGVLEDVRRLPQWTDARMQARLGFSGASGVPGGGMPACLAANSR
jgi:hypothetical protein